MWEIAGQVVLASVMLFFLYFALASVFEHEGRAFRRSGLFFIIIGLGNVFIYMLPDGIQKAVFAALSISSVIFVLGVLISQKPRSSQIIKAKPRRIDERDVIFARFEYHPGSERYKEYYRTHPERKTRDDTIRKLPDILTSFHRNKSPELFPLASAEFDFLEHQLTAVDGTVEEDRTTFTAEKNSELIKRTLSRLGADVSGICELDPSFLYSHVGRGPEKFGSKIDLNHKYAVVFALEMDYAWVAAAPKAPVIVETAKKYVEAAKISIIAADYIRRLGYPARAHIAGSNYQAVLPPLGWQAGLGEMGRMGILVTFKYGPRARLGLITTDLPLIPDRPEVRGILDFCERCKKCAINCPGKAIPVGPRIVENGIEKWVIDREACYEFWRRAGTDCATCLYVCPYSKPVNFFHDAVRFVSAQSRSAQGIFIRGDDLFYGRSPRPRKNPS